jgi:uncharacterized membrane protein (DUF373 family)
MPDPPAPHTEEPHLPGSGLIPPRLLTMFAGVENVIYIGVAVVLLGIAGILLYRTVVDAFSDELGFTQTITAAVNGVLFVVIVLEIYETVRGHLEGKGFQLRPFLIIGVISAVRHILLIGAQSLSNASSEAFNHSQIELAVNAAVAFVLVGALVLLHRSGAASD